jgi:hypothetical protein
MAWGNVCGGDHSRTAIAHLSCGGTGLPNELESSPESGPAVPPVHLRWRRWAWLALTFGLMCASFGIGRFTGRLNGLPAIARTLPGDESEFSRELNDRIREMFPIGTNEDILIKYLDEEDFKPEWRRRDDPNASYYFRQGLLCRQIIRVEWRADATGVLTALNGSYQSQC